MTTDSRPLLFGYLRVLPGMNIDSVVQTHRQLAAFARSRGFVLGNVFVETKWQQLTSWVAMTNRCRRDGVRNVAVPSTEHLSTVAPLADIMCQEIEGDIGGRLWVVLPTAGPAEQEARQ
ncbi:hypothetical protein SZN_07597 [Streptomyces zinciresistens K42]|uniref:Resolvase/invertase-type recombinase catalytic domain-containing protein n=1 Tax=Streptomyces zinciresistens K42 TaxID=700597 RepID=G2G7Q6_9ACTN|nr:hypothetical protein [Streptomyces zinciresistens]EGX60482.1 hypothetical protein SZN_07597 [Streptomyces zinciresistens K42]